MSTASANASATVARGTHDAGRRWLGAWLLAIVLAVAACGFVEAHWRAFMEQGCEGADLLAYRATEAEPLALVRAARRGLGKGHLVVAGSVSTRAQIQALAEAGADAFTIGSAVFDGSYVPDRGSILSQLAAIQADCRTGPR